MRFNPLPHQPVIRDWLSSHDHNLIWCSPGLGKTVVELEWLDDLFTSGKSRGALVIAPLRVAKITWRQQAARWDHSSWMKVADLRTPEGRKAWDEGSAHLYLINFEMLVTRKGSKTLGFIDACIKGRKELPVDTLVIDEISCMKSSQALRFKRLAPYVGMFKQRSGMTGTPMATYLDLWSQVKLIDGGKRLGATFTSFKARWFTSDYMGFVYTLKPGAKEEIDKLLSDLALVMLGSDYLDIPPTLVEDIEVTMPPEAQKHYKTLEKELLLLLKQKEIVALNAAALATKLLQVASGAVYDSEREIHVLHNAKIDALVRLRKQLGKEPLLVLVSYKHEAVRILEAIPGAQMFDEKRLGDWAAGKIHTWVSHYASLAHGIDSLQLGGSKICWFTLTWSGEYYQQANARLARTGQENPTTVYRLIVSSTYDDAVAESLKSKSDEQSGLMNSLKALQMLKE